MFKHRAFKDALDILIMSQGEPFVFTYSSNFGALALQLKQTQENFCSDWTSLDWGKREWPPVGTIGEGGSRGVKLGIEAASKICLVVTNLTNTGYESYCSVKLRPRSDKISAPIRSLCNCR